MKTICRSIRPTSDYWLSFGTCTTRHLRHKKGASLLMDVRCASSGQANEKHDRSVAPRSSQDDLAALKRGKGGRSSFSGMVVTVFGATSYLGRFVCNRMARMGSQVILAHRGDPYVVEKFKVMGDLGQILFAPFDLRNEQSIYDAVKYSNVVINCIGANYATKNFSLYDANVEGSRRLARLAREAGVGKFVQVSSLNANIHPQPILTAHGCEFLRTKALGEAAVKAEFADAIIIRPSEFYGENDNYLMHYINRKRRCISLLALPGRGVVKTLPMWRLGMATVKRPVFVGDVAKAITYTLLDDSHLGKTFELFGPHRYYLADLVRYIYTILQYDDVEFRHIWPLWKFKLNLWERHPFRKEIGLDRVEREFYSDTPTPGCSTLADLGITEPVCVEDRWPYDLRWFRRFAYYGDVLGEFADPIKPRRLTAEDDGLTPEVVRLSHIYA